MIHMIHSFISPSILSFIHFFKFPSFLRHLTFHSFIHEYGGLKTVPSDRHFVFP